MSQRYSITGKLDKRTRQCVLKVTMETLLRKDDKAHLKTLIYKAIDDGLEGLVLKVR